MKLGTVDEIIRKLNLQPLPGEGGYFRRTYQSATICRPFPGNSSERAAGTAIYFLITSNNFSALHRLVFDEVYHFYAGDPVDLIQIAENGDFHRNVLGPDILGGQSPQIVVSKGIWQGSRVCEGGKWSLVGATMAPGFDYADAELGKRDQLCMTFPQHRDLINQFTRTCPK